MGPFDVAVAFWIFLGVATVAGIAGDVLKRRASLKPLRLAIERGQPLDAEVVQALLARTQEEDGETDPVHMQVGGIITTASGVGVMALGWFVAQVEPRALFPVIGAGVVTVCVGIGLLLAARVLERRARERHGVADRAA